MTNFFANDERQHREKQIANALEQPQLARVVAVKERHPEAEDRWEQGDNVKSDVVNDFRTRQFEVDLSAPHLATVDKRTGTKTVGERMRDVPVLAGADGEARVPEPGRDLALIVFMEGENKRSPVVIGFHYHKDYFPPVARRGTWRMQKGEVCFEAYEDRDRPEQDDIPEYAIIGLRDNDEQDTPPDPADAYLGVIQKGSPNNVEDEYEIRLQDSAGSYIELDGEGDINIHAEGEVNIEGDEGMSLDTDGVLSFLPGL